MDDWNLDDKPLGEWQILQHFKSIIPGKFKEMKNNVGFTFSVGDTTPQLTISIEQDNKSWWHKISYSM